MKQVLSSILLLAFLTSTAWAQTAEQGDGQGFGTGPHGPGKGQRMARMQQALGLSQDQVEQITEIRRNGGGRDDVRAVLTDEQRAMMDEHRAARQKQGRGGRGYRHGQGPAYGAQRGETPSEEEDKQG